MIVDYEQSGKHCCMVSDCGGKDSLFPLNKSPIHVSVVSQQRDDIILISLDLWDLLATTCTDLKDL